MFPGRTEGLAKVVAIQLVADNLHYLRVLNLLTAHTLRQSALSDVTSAIAAFESMSGDAIADTSDTYTAFPIVEVPFYERTYTVLQGLTEDSGTVIRHLLPSIFGRYQHRFPDTFVRNVRAATRLLLGMSERAALFAGLELFENVPPESGLVLPDQEHLTALAEALVVFESDLFSGLPGAKVAYLQSSFFAELETLPEWNGRDVDEDLIRRPFVRTGGGKVLIAAPHELMLTLRDAIVREATAHECHPLLQTALTAHAKRLTGQLCDTLFDDTPTASSSLGHTILTGALDIDKTLEIRTHVPSLRPSTTSVFGDVLSLAPPPVEAGRDERKLLIDVIWPLGRDCHILTPNEPRRLCTTFDDLETILKASGHQQLSLWYFADALDRLGDSAETMLHGGLADLYAYYREGNESFYAGDDVPPPTALIVDSSDGDVLRQEHERRHRRTFVNIGNVVHESNLCHGESTSVREVLALPRIIFSADFPDFVVWIELDVPSPTDAVRLHSIAEAFAYWSFHIYREQPGLFSAWEHEVQIMLVETEWDGETDRRWIRQRAAIEGKDLTFEFRSPTHSDKAASPNAVDRELLAEFLSVLRRENGSGQSDNQPDRLLDILAPPGERRMIHVLRSDGDPIAWPGGLPSARTVAKPLVGHILDELGAHLRLNCNRPVGDIPVDERTRVLNDEVVVFLRDRLARTLAECNTRQLLHHLIRANEALLYQQHTERIQYPARLACFGHEAHEVRELAQRISEMTTAAVSSRFLIEYCATLQPTAGKTATNEHYDTVLAIASEIVHKGFLSDAIHAGLSNADLMILASGRLGISRDTDRWVAALQGLLSANAQSALDDATRSDNHDTSDDDTTSDLPTADGLATIEWGFSFSEITLFSRELVTMSLESDQQDVGTLMVSDVHQRLSSTHTWSDEKISALLTELTLTRETDFWSLGPEVFPWRYNRTHSYLRRPLIVYTENGKDFVTFGYRNLLRTSFEMHGQYLSGRLKAQSSEMKAALSVAKDRKGNRFEERVVANLRVWCSNVRRRVRRFGRHDLRKINGRNLGDIDVVAFEADTATLFLIEAKALLVARTPREMANEFAALIEGPTSAAERLRLRSEWVTENLEDVLTELRIRAAAVTVQPLIVIDTDLLSKRLDCPYPVVTAASLQEPFRA
ncbi:hypothetical protein BN1047_04283 [Mycolicibacterium neoaurum]|uniref:Protein NO VEIN C-terminal domain-containing protein n=1 Tax=Mycolicibacterium neoaurum TaxID=1795 RepID=A0AAV2WPZ9_MYCNE|nr:hypothetical protein BN1047_04283 [Mycolicibacterium neoaurum]